MDESRSNSGDGQGIANEDAGNAANDDSGGGGGGGYDDGDSDNEDWSLWEENDHDFYTISFRVSTGYIRPQNGQIPVFTHEFLIIIIIIY
jgi:hypothetical protein